MLSKYLHNASCLYLKTHHCYINTHIVYTFTTIIKRIEKNSNESLQLKKKYLVLLSKMFFKLKIIKKKNTSKNVFYISEM